MAKKRGFPPDRGGRLRHQDLLSIVEHFEDLPDPRRDPNKRHKLIDITVLCLCGVPAGCDALTEIEESGKHKEDLFRAFLELPNGIPSHDTFGRVFGLLDRGSFDHAEGLRPLHVLSVWCGEHNLILGQTVVDLKGNEINALPATVEKLNLEGPTVSIGAAGCQRAVATVTGKKTADYVLALKGHHGYLNDDVRPFFEACVAEDFNGAAHSLRGKRKRAGWDNEFLLQAPATQCD